tara:strand:- start:3424 stop:4410 length:987 start_codon:yes stop_codon:yes gene_type:complete
MKLKRFLIPTILVTIGGFSLTPNIYAIQKDKVSVTGFIDMSTVRVDSDTETVIDSGFDQFEIDFSFDLGSGVSAQVDLEYENDGDGEEFDIEQAFVTYSVNDALSFKAGRFLSYSGWETEDPTGLYQYSKTGYAKYFYGGYQQGFSVYYKAPKFDVALSVTNDLGDLKGETRGSEDPAVELMLAVNLIETLDIKGFYMTDKLEGTNEDIQLINVWSSYILDEWTFAAEYNQSENAPAAVGFAGVGAEANGYLLLANYVWDRAGVTFRYNNYEVETESGTTVEDLKAFTLAPSYMVSENFLIILEYRRDKDSITNESTNTYALEFLLSF